MAKKYDDETAQNIANLQDVIYSNPKTRREYLRLVKTVAPNTPIPELDVENQVHAAVKPQLDEIAKLRTELEADRQSRAVEAEWARANVSAEERVEVEKVMTERLIGDVATAVRFYRDRRAEEQAAAMPLSGPSVLQMPREGVFKGLMENPDGWGRQQAAIAIRELQAQRT